jgi:hypothetical protein
MGRRVTTNFGDRHSHDTSITNNIEDSGRQVFYQHGKDWHDRTEECHRITLNDRSSRCQAEWADAGV